MRHTTLLAALTLSLAQVAQAQDDVPRGFQFVGFNILSGYDWEMPDPLDPTAKPPKNVIPATVKALDGKMVYLKGFMLPLDLDAQGVTKFMLNASIDMCYFGAPVRLNDWIMITMKPGKKAKFTHLPTGVWGRLEVGEEVRNGRIVSIYRLTAEDAKTEGGA
ncbi:MAG: DUF3299 domain-containing protein [Gemmatimonadetes bacterium]|nr:DUF3299 domain-containing protein [Gemmatimonadota bacterium]